MANKWIRQSIAITLVLLACVLPLQGPALRVGAHEDEHVHTFLSAEAAELLPKGSPMYAEISAYLEQIKDGAYQEDHHDLVYADLTHNIEGVRCIPHFWDADAGPGELVKDLWGVDRYPNAYQKALRLFQMALDAYPPVGDTQRPAKAYTLLGHVAHLLEDMTVPCHVHEDFHAGEWLPGGDDCFEDWYYDGDHRHPYKDWTAASALAQGGALYFPHTIAEEMREGDWATGLFYLMYTTNQHADYFASDDVDGDTHEPYGWVDYTGWPSSPTTHDQLGDNDHVSYMGEVTDNDNDGDGDMSAIANYSCVYGIRAVAALYRMFYEATHPPQVSMSIDYSDENGDGQADYPWVSLSLDYQAGADEYGHDLQVRYRNEGDEWTAWRAVSQRRSWFLPGGDGQKTVSCQVRNLLGLTGVASATASLKEVALPQLFEYQFSATGPASLHSTVDFYIREL
jgi:hypothetical protein